MNLNHFESFKETTLEQILQTLDNVHGVKFNVDFKNPNLITNLIECKSSYEGIRDKIINESAFNSYQTNPEYIKSMLVLEAVKLLIEIAPKRMKRRKMNEHMMSGEAPKPTLAMQLSGIAAKIPNTSEQSAAFSNALASISDKLTNRTPLDDMDRHIVGWLKSLPRPIHVHNIITHGIEEFGDALAQGRETDMKKWPGIPPSWMDKDKKVAAEADMSRPPVQPVGTNPLQVRKIIPGQPARDDGNEYRQNAIAAIISNHSKGLITPEVAKQQLQGQGVNPADLDNVLNGRTSVQQGAPAPGSNAAQPTTPPMRENTGIMKATQTKRRPDMGNVSEMYANERKKLALELRMLNEFDAEGFDANSSDSLDLDRANVIIAAKGIVGKIQDMAEDVAKLGVDELMPLVDIMREQFGPEVSDGFNSTFKAALDKLLDLTTSTKDELSTSVDTLAKGGVPSQASELGQTGPDELPSTSDEPFDSDEDIMNDLNGPDGEGSEETGEAEPALGREKKDELAENWGKKGGPSNPEDVGRWKGKTIAQLEAHKARLMKKEKRTKEEQKTVSEINFAIRAKHKGAKKWGDVEESNVAETKGKLPPWLKKDKNGKVVKADKKVDETTVKEVAPPGKKAEDFIKDAKPDFKKRYGKNWEKRLYATAWKKFGESTETYLHANEVMYEAKRRIELLKDKLNGHKNSFAKSLKEGNHVDPLGLGYGLEGDTINQNIQRLNKKIVEAKSVMLHEMQVGIKKLLSDIQSNKKITAMLETKQRTPYGIMYKVSNGKKSLKMFETSDIRNRWVELNKDTLSEYQLVDPETFDKAIRTLTR